MKKTITLQDQTAATIYNQGKDKLHISSLKQHEYAWFFSLLIKYFMSFIQFPHLQYTVFTKLFAIYRVKRLYVQGYAALRHSPMCFITLRPQISPQASLKSIHPSTYPSYTTEVCQ